MGFNRDASLIPANGKKIGSTVVYQRSRQRAGKEYHTLTEAIIPGMKIAEITLVKQPSVPAETGSDRRLKLY